MRVVRVAATSRHTSLTIYINTNLNNNDPLGTATQKRVLVATVMSTSSPHHRLFSVPPPDPPLLHLTCPLHHGHPQDGPPASRNAAPDVPAAPRPPAGRPTRESQRGGTLAPHPALPPHRRGGARGGPPRALSRVACAHRASLYRAALKRGRISRVDQRQPEGGVARHGRPRGGVRLQGGERRRRRGSRRRAAA